MLLHCSHCRELKEPEAFYVDSGTRRGRVYYCRVCYKLRYNYTERQRIYMRAYRAKHGESYRLYQKLYQRRYSQTHKRKPPTPKVRC